MKILCTLFCYHFSSGVKRENLKSYCEHCLLRNFRTFFVSMLKLSFDQENHHDEGVFEKQVPILKSKNDEVNKIFLICIILSKQLPWTRLALLTAIKRGYYCKNFYEAITQKRTLHWYLVCSHADSCLNINLPMPFRNPPLKDTLFAQWASIRYV